ncbi:unnamed protein product [Paramecium sonneborni]|uniref:Uncharacterized protein n=1 Tax=Paramecium sonneborni TaxID=65129 RepID=A0A8S1P1A9_9CILI|nr:unnamed protein product [Paramecium sonneborni]
MQQIKNIYQLPTSIDQNSRYFLRPKRSALPSMLEPYQDIKLNYQLPKLTHQYSQSSSEESTYKKQSASNLQKLSSHRYLSRFVRSTTIQEPILKKNQEIISSCDLKIKEHKKQLAKVQIKLQTNQAYSNYLHQELSNISNLNNNQKHENSINFYNYQEPKVQLSNQSQMLHFRLKFKRFRTNQSPLDQ